ncbi:hypothetical protein SYNPS1DRAFT_10858, partial [Syncephalis pseudoplumigaleata]
LVTGGEGFLGRHVVEALIRCRPAAQIRILDVYRSSIDRPPHVHAVVGDLTDRRSVEAACRGVTAIFHVASLLTPDMAMARRVNIDGTRHLLAAAEACGVRRILFVSSATVVLNRTPIFDADESMPYASNPPDPYIAFKAEAERLVMSWGKKPGRLVCSLRPSFIYGHGDRQVAPVAMQLARSAFYRWGYGDGCVTNVIYVENAAHALLRAEELLQPGSRINGEIINIHDGYTINLYELARNMAREIKLPHADGLLQWRCPWLPVVIMVYLMHFISLLLYPLVSWTPPLRIRDILMADLPHTFSNEKAKQLLNYVPPIDPSEALHRTRPWLRK